jgi:hypothetical protein
MSLRFSVMGSQQCQHETLSCSYVVGNMWYTLAESYLCIPPMHFTSLMIVLAVGRNNSVLPYAVFLTSLGGPGGKSFIPGASYFLYVKLISFF